MKKVQILGVGCAKCVTLTENAQTAARDLGVECAVEKVTDIHQILNFGVMMTPALVIDGAVKSVGKVNSVEEIKAMLRA